MRSERPYHRYLLLLIACTTLLRLLFINTTELGADEVYYWSFALRPQWNYFDHPPVVAWLIRATTVNMHFQTEFAVRIGAVLCCMASTWLFFKLGSLLGNYKTGWYAAILYNSSVYCSVFMGGHIIPDSPQMVFWLLSVLILLKISRRDALEASPHLLWCLFGLTAGLAILCKVHGVFLWFGAAGYGLALRRDWWRQRSIYLSALVTILVVSPVIIWNIQHDFISYRFHSDRVAIGASAASYLLFGKALAGQIAIDNPFNFFLTCSSLWLMLRTGLTKQTREIKLLLWLSMPLIVLILVFSIFRETFPHWPAPAYTTLLLLPALRLSQAPKYLLNSVPGPLRWALAYVVFVAVLEVFMVDYFPGTTSSDKQGMKTGRKDYTLDMFGWAEAGTLFDALRKGDLAKHTMPAKAPLLITNWAPGASIEYYIAAATGQKVAAIGSISDLHQYYWTNPAGKALREGDDAYYVVPSSDFNYRTFNILRRHFRYCAQAAVLPQYRNNALCRYLYVYRMRGFLSRVR